MSHWVARRRMDVRLKPGTTMTELRSTSTVSKMATRARLETGGVVSPLLRNPVDSLAAGIWVLTAMRGGRWRGGPQAVADRCRPLTEAEHGNLDGPRRHAQ